MSRYFYILILFLLFSCSDSDSAAPTGPNDTGDGGTTTGGDTTTGGGTTTGGDTTTGGGTTTGGDTTTGGGADFVTCSTSGDCSSCTLGTLEAGLSNNNQGCNFTDCENVIEIGTNGNVYYNFNQDITGFQFNVKGFDIDDIVTTNTSSENWNVVKSSIPPIGEKNYTIIGYHYSGNVSLNEELPINSGCGILLTIDFEDGFDNSQVEVTDIVFCKTEENQDPFNICNNN